MSQLILATAIELRRVHGVKLAAHYLFEAGIALETALEILTYSGDGSPKVQSDTFPKPKELSQADKSVA